MTEIKIWSDIEIEIYDHPPSFNSIQRKKFLTLPVKLKKRTQSFYTTANKVGFHLMFGYFKARRRFFLPERFNPFDIRFIGKRLGLLFFDGLLDDYNRKTYNRHRKIILAHFGYDSFKLQKHHLLITQLITKSLWSFDRAHLILGNILDWLEYRHIELPSYYALQTILTIAIRKRDRTLHQTLDKLLQPNHKTALDHLLIKSNAAATENTKAVYAFTSLKKLIRKDNPKSIRANIDKHELVWQIFQQIQSLLPELELNEAAIRYFGELVIKYKSSQITQRSLADKYLLLLGFTAFQIRSYEDQLVDILLSACRGGLNTAHHKHKEYLFASRKERKEQSKKITDMAQSKHDLLKEVKAIIWDPKANVIPQSAIAVEQVRQILPLIEGQDEDQETLDLMQQQHVKEEQIALLNCLEKVSLSLQQQVSPIIKTLHFNIKTSPSKLIIAIHHFRDKDGKISKTAPSDFLEDDQKEILFDEDGRFKISLYKILLFQTIYRGIKSGQLNLKYSYRYKAYDEYLINAIDWKEQQKPLLEKAKLTDKKDFKTVLKKLKPLLNEHFHQTNQRILKEENPHFILREDGKYLIKTPKVDTENRAKSLSIFPNEKIIPISEVLATIDDLTNYSTHFKHYQPYYRKQRPSKNVFFADIMAYGCNLGVEKMAKVARSVTATELENTANWYFDLENIQKATDTINNFMDKLELPNLFRKKKEELHTSSDGQKIAVASDTTIDAHYSFKYFGRGKGVTSYSFIDERFIPFYSTVINTTEREAIYVVDGLLHNETIRSTTHSTDTHGYTEAVFGLMDILGFGFAP
jgi:hypothetical protein